MNMNLNMNNLVAFCANHAIKYVYLILVLAAVVVSAASVDGDLRVEVVTAYNLVVDSNIETPAGRCPTAAHLGVRVYNTGATPMTGVTLRIGDLLNPATFSGTSGVYPLTTVSPETRPYSGTFSFTHEGGTSDATRYIPSIPAGGSVVAYWLVSYPVKDLNGKSVAGAANVVADDLRLDYDIWVEGYENGSTLRRVYAERQMTCRNEISAMANKIWPNTTSKVPDQYLDIFAEQLGWRPSVAQPRVPGANIAEGIWYDFGTVRYGFDNNGDLIPDYNAWMQPVGDPSVYDASCFRLVKAYGVVIVKLNDGTEKIIPFEDELYFQNLPKNNVGAVGLVFYEFLALKQGCTGRLSPYQEVASGYDNEKFNADYGASIGSWQSKEISATFDKNAPAITNAGATVTYDMTAHNTGVLEIGQPSLSLPAVITDYVPTGLVYVAASATANNTLSPGVGISVRYSTNGTDWVLSEPVPASNIVALQWWLDAPLPAGTQVTVRFQSVIPSGYTGVTVRNCGGMSLGNSEPFARDCATTIISGVNSLSGVVFEDDGAGVNFANGIRETNDVSETGIPAVLLKLYLDVNGNGVKDSGDMLVATQDSAASTGTYIFTNLPDGRYLVSVDPLDPQVTDTYALTTPSVHAVDLDAAHSTTSPVNVTERNFGFAPPLSLTKTGDATVSEGQDITYTLTMKNHLYSQGAVSSANLYWMPSNAVMRAELGLTNVVNISTNTGIANLDWGICVDKTRKCIYWANQTTDRIEQDDLDQLTPANPTTLISGVTDPGYLAIDAQAPGGKQYLWWSTRGKLHRADLGAVPPVPEDRYAIISDIACGVAIDEVNRWIYFVSQPGGNDKKYYLYRQSLDGAANTRDLTWEIKLGGKEICDLEIDVVAQKLYYVDHNTGVLFKIIDIATKADSSPFNVSNGLDVQGLAVDVAADRVYFSDSVAGQIICRVISTGATVATYSSGANPGDIDIGNVAGSGTFGVNTTIGTLRLTDTYPTNKLTFVSATVPPDLTTPSGTLTWNSLGPLNGGDSLTIDVTFKAVSQPGNGTVSLTNYASVTTALLVNRDTVNKPSANAPGAILPAGSITGKIWADVNNNGWQPAQTAPGTTFPSYGYEAGERGIGGVRVRLEADSNSDGTVDWAVTNRTDASGNYLFPSLATNMRYRVTIDTASLPGTGITATGDPDDDGVNAGNGASDSADNLWNNAGAGWFSLGVNSWKNASGTAQSWDITNVNFGYYGTDPVIYGLVWLDLDRDGVRDAGEPGLSGASVALTGAFSATLLSQADGTYIFRTNSEGAALTTGSYTVTVTPPSGPTWIYTFESATNTFGVSNSNSPLNGVMTFPVTSVTETSGSWNFGLIVEGVRKIGDTVYFDMDANGAQGTNEVGIAGVDVKLYLDTNGNGLMDATDFLWTTQTTDANGKYLFTNLASSVYFVVVNESDIPTGFRQTADPDQQGVVATAGDGMGTVTLGATDILTIDFGYAPQGSGRIGDTVFADANGNGLQDAGEGGISNVTVWLYYDRDGGGSYETLLASTQTGAGGTYLFPYLLDGSYQAVVDKTDTDIPAHLMPSTVVTHTVTLSSQVTTLFDGFTTPTDRSLDADYAFATRPYIGDFVFYDANINGTPDIGEVGIPNVTLKLYSSEDVLLATTSTADGSGALPRGYYQFSNLTTGIYYVVVDTATLPTWNGSPLLQTADPDRDGVPVWDNSIPGLPAGDNADTGIMLRLQPYLGTDFGYQPFGVIGDTVWRDLNNSGVQETGDTGVPGVKITAVMGSVTNTTYTDSDGHYSFAGLDDGTWTVTVAPANFVSSGPLNEWIDTYDADGGLNHSTSVVIHNGSVSSAYNAWTTRSDASLDVDFGFRLNGPYSLAGTVCTDDAGVSGICDDPANETELGGRTVYLYTSANLLLGSTVTDASGHYNFANLPSGGYRVVLGTTVPPLDTARLTTTASDTGTTLLTDTGTSVIQDVTVADANREGIDFAFVPTVFFDYGDLPAVYGITTLVQDGARHAIPTNGVTVWLGTVQPDADTDGVPTALANGDDTLDGSDDEDGIVPLGIASWVDGVNGGSVQVTVRAPAGLSGYLVGWIDFNQDGSLIDSGEQIISTAVTGTGNPQTAAYTFDIPAGTMATTNKAWAARFRVFAEPPPLPLFSYTGSAADGEVEDYFFSASDLILGDRVWNDANGDGVQDAEESGLSEVIVYLDSNANSIRDEGELYNTTSGDGYYALSDNSLEAGTCFVRVDRSTLSSDYVATYDIDGTGSADAASVVLETGQDRLDVDFGYRIPPRLGDFVWVDANGNGQQDVGELGLSNVVVRLYAPNSVILATVTSTVSGAYAFTNLAVGTYTVDFTPPAGYLFTTSNVGDDASDSDPLTRTNRTAAVTLASGQSDITVDAGFYPGATLSGFVRVDINGNGTIEADDTNGIAGVTVQLLDASMHVVETAVTAANGAYSFADLYPGVYTVCETDLTGWYSTADVTSPNDNLIPVTLVIGQILTENNFYDTVPGTGTISGTVWNDANGNGVIDDESRFGSIVVYFDVNDNGALDSGEPQTQTDGDGNYAFINLSNGTYQVTVDKTLIPAGYTHRSYDYDGVETPDWTVVVLETGSAVTDVDFGYNNHGSISGLVWIDTNTNGVRYVGELELTQADVTVRLYDAFGILLDSHVTDTNGNYVFENLSPRSYRVEFVPPSGYGFTPMDQGDDDWLDSDANPYTGLSDFVTVVPSGDVIHIDAGLIPVLDGLIGDFVWEDLDGNGLHELNEPGLAGVKVDLYTALGAPFQVRTDLGSFADDFDTPEGGSSGFDGSDGLLVWNGPWTSVYGVDVVLSGESYLAESSGGVGSDLTRTCTTPAGTEQITFSFDYTMLGDDTYVSEYSIDGGSSWNTLGTYASPMPSEHVSYAVAVSGGTTVTLRFRKTAKSAAPDKLYIDNVDILNESGFAEVNTTTDINGFYFFEPSTKLVDGAAYQVRIATNQTALTGMALTMANQGADDAKDSDAVLTNGDAMIPLTWVADESNLTLDAGFKGSAAIKGLVWFDPNSNALLDSGETNAIAVTVDLWFDANANGVIDAGDQCVRTQTTDGTNLTNFAFADLTAGQYLVTVTDVHGVLTGYSLTTDNDPAGWSRPVAVALGETRNDVDFGFYIPPRLYGYAFWDKDGSLTRNAEDGAVTNMVVQLWFDGVQIATTNTTANGYYDFQGLTPGTNEVRFIYDTNYLSSIPTNGAALTDIERNRAVATADGYATVTYTLYSGHGIGEDTGEPSDLIVDGEPVNAGFLDGGGGGGGDTTSSGIDLRAYRAADGVYVEFVAYDVEQDGEIRLYLLGADGTTVWTGTTSVVTGERSVCRFLVPGLEAGCTYSFAVFDEVGNYWSAPSIAVGEFTVEMTHMSLAGMMLSFNSLPDREYEIQWTEHLGTLWQTVTNVPSQGEQTSVVVKHPAPQAPSGFFKIILK